MTRFTTLAFVLILGAATSAAWATPISDKYAQLGGAAGFLGLPTIAETPTPDGVGRYRHYVGGSIYWHPRTGAHEVHGLIGQRWAELNWEQGYLGYPITDEIPTVDGGGRVSRFEGGELIWRERTNTVREVKARDLVVELPFPAGETWRVTQAHGVEGLGPASHFGRFAYCWDFVRLAGSAGTPFTAVANGRIVHADDSYGSGKANANPGNVTVQRLGPSRYASYLHSQTGSYMTHFGEGALSLPQATPWSTRPSASTGDVLAAVGDTGADVGQHHLHFCVTTAPDRGVYGPFESVPVSFRNYEVLGPGFIWTDVIRGVPRRDQRLRRKGTQGPAAINAAASPIGSGAVTAVLRLAGPGRPSSSGVITLTVLSAWGEPLRTETLPIGNTSVGPWMGTITGVPAHTGLKVVATYSGGWSVPTTGGWIGGTSNAFGLDADTSVFANVDLEVQF